MATGGVVTWSKTAATNATADPAVNWAEGMAPSAVNDSARAQMASTAKWRDDISGALTTGGTSTAYTLVTNATFATLAAMNAQIICFVPNVTNGADPTLAVDGLTAKPIRTATGANVASGVLVAGTPYQTVYYSAAGEFILMGFLTNPFNVPLGIALPFFMPTAPNSSFVFPFGQAISRITYATLFVGMSTQFGTGDGSTTFNLPDLRGRACFGKDDMGGSAASRLTATTMTPTGDTLGGTGGAQTVTLSQANLPVATLTTTITDPGHDHAQNASTLYDAGLGTGGSGNHIGVLNVALRTVSNTTGITASTALGGSGTATNNMPPAIVCNYIMRII